MQVTSMLSAGYLEPMQQIAKVQNVKKITEEDQSKAQKEQEILAEEQSLKAKLGNNAQVHTVYHYSVGTDGRRYIVGASVTMKGSEEDLNRVSGGIPQEDLQSRKQEAQESLKKDVRENEKTQNIIKSEAEKRKVKQQQNKSEIKKDEAAKELENIQREVISHENAHKAAAGELGGVISYSYTEGPDGKSYITGGEVPIKIKEGDTPEETLRNMQKVQRAANAPAEPSGQDRQVAAKAAALASKARTEIINSNSESVTEVARGTPIIDSISREDEIYDFSKDGANSVLASVKEFELQNLMPAA
ncbi:MAG: hypothetical protein IJQ57_10175 [Synergistaceae bacterium]|nr:hypothetical protein [Synergistaceae bacterium]MBR0253703.1 hypothetical protein [Synergistaceae bacterium]